VLRRLALLALIPTIAATSGARGALIPAELAYTIGYAPWDVACVAGAGGILASARLAPMGAQGGAWSPDGERFALSSRRGILVENADGSGLQVLTSPRRDEDDGAPAWSPDGAWIAFSRYTGSPRSGIWIVDVATGRERQISGDYADSLSWSPAGDLLAADFGYLDSWRHAALLRLDGTVVRALAAPFDRTFAPGVAWSPDGTRIAVGGGLIFDRSGAIVGRYAAPTTPARDAIAASPTWSPDGSTIAYELLATAYDGRTNVRYALPSDLYEAPAAGGPAVALTRTPELSERAPAFRPGTHAAPAGLSQRCVIRGTSKDDVIRGTAKADLILAGAGNDRVLGRAGADVIYGGPGNDVLFGGPGGDWLLGGPGNDRLHARDGSFDVVYGGPAGHDVAWVDRRDLVTGVERIEAGR
jgi:hypothetical protein